MQNSPEQQFGKSMCVSVGGPFLLGVCICGWSFLTRCVCLWVVLSY